MSGARLIGDIGGTNARFAVAKDGRLDHIRVLHTGAHPSFADALREYLSALPADARPSLAAVAIAGPVAADAVALTNHKWSFSIARTKHDFGFSEFLVVNDFAATAMAVPYLAAAERVQIGGDEPVGNGPVGIIGPGTGLGMGGLIALGSAWLQVPGEGGHATMPAATEEESRILDLLRARFGHVSAERVLSGQGLENLYDAVCRLADAPARAAGAGEIAEAALAGADPHADRALDLFCAMLGTVAGNLALTLGATGGVFIAGGILPRFTERFAASSFRRRFEAKGRMSKYLETVPTYLILHPWPALLGLANLRSPAATPSGEDGNG